MAPRAMVTVVDDLAFPEGPRWRDGWLWFSDMHAKTVQRFNPLTAELVHVLRVETLPSGLGWLPEGDLLVVSMLNRQVLRMHADCSVSTHADLWNLALFHCNDMVTDSRGNSYVGNFGYDLYGGTIPFRPTNLVLVRPDGRASIVAGDLAFPNGCVITPNGSTLIVGESGAGRLTSFRIADDATLHDRRVWAELPAGQVPDGICLDAEGAVWSACPRTGVVSRIAEGGRVLESIALDPSGSSGEMAYACTLGGADGTTLFICGSTSHHPDVADAARGGRIVAVEVDVPGVGTP